jgi:tetratricopeptide (TPR) repeat protein
MLLSFITWATIGTAVAGASPDSIPLYDNLGSYHRGITTRSAVAQKYFNQGLRLVYAFNHGEAIRAFQEGARRDPRCAMCYWGIALAYGPNVNAAMDSASGAAAYAAVREALARRGGASRVEQALIDAQAARYAPVPDAANRAALDSAYARAMEGVVRRHPDDLDAATLYAEALMALRPWNYWQPSGDPQPGTDRMVAQLERVMARSPEHPGACHYYIHAVEARMPEKAVACAERLAALMPGAGHLVHMPGHIYIRVGRWADAIDANVHALHADRSYIEGAKPEGAYPIAYYPHNFHFLAFASTMSGRSAQAIEAARGLVERVPVDVARKVPDVEPLVSFLDLTLVTFGRWDEVLARPLPPADLSFASAMTQYARGVAFAATGRTREAEAALEAVGAAAAAAPAGTPQTVLQIASHALDGEIALRGGRRDLARAERSFRQAAELEDALLYMEPPFWYYPIRHSLGRTLLEAGKPAEAERVYREDLRRFPANGWALFGLAESLKAQGKAAEAQAARVELDRAWAGADVQLMGSRF